MEKMEKRITIKEMLKNLSSLVDDGFGDRFLEVSGYYVGKTYDVGEGKDPFNSVAFEEIHYSDIPLTPEQEEWVKNDLEQIKSEYPELFIFPSKV